MPGFRTTPERHAFVAQHLQTGIRSQKRAGTLSNFASCSRISRLMHIRSTILFLATLLAFVSAADSLAQGFGGQDILPATEYVDWTIDAEDDDVASGSEFDLQIGVRIDDGWKMYAPDSPQGYGAEFRFDDLPPGIQRVGEVQQSAAIDAYDPFFEGMVRYYEGEADFRIPLHVASDADPGPRLLEGEVTFMICNEVLCLPPTTLAVETSFDVSAGSGISAGSADESSTGGGAALVDGEREGTGDVREGAAPYVPRDLENARSGGLPGFILLAIAAGFAALLTPCVFPMIPLTVSYFTKHTGNRAESVRMASVYGASIVLTFTALGVLTALFVGAAGAQTIAANPWINVSIGLIFIVFALSLLGLFELRLPNGLLNYFNRQGNQRGGYLGVVFMGLTLTLVSFSCTAPFVGGLLAATASDEWAYPVLGMLIFSATFSMPFIIFALFPNALSALPRSGAWMNTVKVVLGFVELAAAMKFLSNADLIWGWGLISRPLAIAFAVVIFFLTGTYLVGKLRLSHDPPHQGVGVVRLLFAIGFFGLSLYMLPGLFGAPLNALDAYLPPRQMGDVSLISTLPNGAPSRESDLEWMEDVDAAYALGRQQDQPVFVDFTGYTCTNCRQMEANVFPQPAISSRLQDDFVLVRLYTDDREKGPDLQRFQLRTTGTVALPTYAVLDPHTQTLLARTTGLATASDFAAFLEHGLAEYRTAALALDTAESRIEDVRSVAVYE